MILYGLYKIFSLIIILLATFVDVYVLSRIIFYNDRKPNEFYIGLSSVVVILFILVLVSMPVLVINYMLVVFTIISGFLAGVFWNLRQSTRQGNNIIETIKAARLISYLRIIICLIASLAILAGWLWIGWHVAIEVFL